MGWIESQKKRVRSGGLALLRAREKAQASKAYGLHESAGSRHKVRASPVPSNPVLIREGEPDSLNSWSRANTKVLGWKQGKGEYSLLQEIRPTKIH